jgi:hypothetical protein
MQLALHRQRGAPLDLLRDDLGQEVGFGEILGADDDPVAARTVEQGQNEAQNCR